MKKLLLFLGALPIMTVVYSQNCNQTLPSSAIVINADGEHTNSGDQIWVCYGVTLDISGDGNLVYVERNCNITISGNTNVVYQKNQGSTDITGDENSLTHEDKYTPTDNGTMNTILSCDTIHIDYSNAPSAGCDPYVGMLEAGKQTFRVYPNPASDLIKIESNVSSDLTNYEIYNLNGQMIQSGRLEQNLSIDVSNLESGMYFLNVNSSQGVHRTQITVQ